jgi:hypothetical protein
MMPLTENASNAVTMNQELKDVNSCRHDLSLSCKSESSNSQQYPSELNAVCLATAPLQPYLEVIQSILAYPSFQYPSFRPTMTVKWHQTFETAMPQNSPLW